MCHQLPTIKISTPSRSKSKRIFQILRKLKSLRQQKRIFLIFIIVSISSIDTFFDRYSNDRLSIFYYCPTNHYHQIVFIFLVHWRKIWNPVEKHCNFVIFHYLYCSFVSACTSLSICVPLFIVCCARNELRTFNMNASPTSVECFVEIPSTKPLSWFSQ